MGGGDPLLRTAPDYGLGLSERRLGAALRDYPREAYTVSTKVGRILEALQRLHGDDLANGFAVPASHRRRWDLTAAGVERSLADSLRRLGLDRIDIAYLHDPDEHAEQALREAYPALEKLRDQGVIGARMQVPCQKHGINLRAAALQFPFGHFAVSSVLLGARSPDEVRDAVEQAKRPIPVELWHELHTTGLLPENVPRPEQTRRGSAACA